MEQIDLEMVRGDDESWVFDVSNDEQTDIDFTGCRFDLHIKPEKGAIIKLSTTTGEIAINKNQITVTLPHEKTEKVTWETASWDLQCIDQNDLVTTLAGGEFVLTQDVTVVDDDNNVSR